MNELIEFIILGIMMGILLFQRRILLFFKQVHKHSNSHYTFIFEVILALISLFFCFYERSSVLISFYFFLCFLYGKIIMFTEELSLRSIILTMIMGSGCFFLWMLFLSMLDILSFLDMIAGCIFFVNFIDFMRFSYHIARELPRFPAYYNAVAKWLKSSRYREMIEKRDFIIDSVSPELKISEYVIEDLHLSPDGLKITLPLKNGGKLLLKLVRYLHMYVVYEPGVKVLEGEKR